MAKFITFILLGIILFICGVLNIRGNISTIHSYNRRKIIKDDIPKYGKCMGIGSLIIGLSLIIAGVLEVVFKTSVFDYLILFCIVIGVIIMLYAQIKYNKGIF